MNKKYNKIYFFAYSLILLSYMFSRITFANIIIDNIKYLGYLILAFIILKSKKYLTKELIIFTICFIILIVNAYITKEHLLLKAFLLIFAAKNIDLNDFIKFDLKIRIIYIVTIIVLSLIGLTNDYNMIEGDTIRYSLGFSHPNTLAFMVMLTNIELLFLNEGIFKKKSLLLLIPSLFIIIFIADSRTNLFTLIIIYLMSSICRKINFDNKIIRYIATNQFYIMTVFSIILLYLYSINTPFGNWINVALTGRLKFVLQFYNEYKINLFGNYIELIPSEVYYKLGLTPKILDNAYFHLLIHYGILIYFIMAYVIKKIVAFSIDTKKYILFAIMTVFILSGITETYLFRIECNIFLLFFAYCIFKRTDRNEQY